LSHLFDELLCFSPGNPFPGLIYNKQGVPGFALPITR